MSGKEKARKPNVSVAMTNLIEQVRAVIPFDIPPSQLCDGPCTGCPKKLIEYLDTELEEWEYRIKQDEQPSLGDVHRLGKTSKRIYVALKKNGLIQE
ncbi:hypothetical protein [Neptuniibacter sp.]|uniref:hypothetical protein n=1 Tax=Neptuniibacter sp. TaxID=1962643 RepID=UPI00262A5BE0|nr:hypothetical protein [Neptuniibacter sp.]MCP4596253.1 hypothetical protein [Neptuniibacter sp.]